GALQSAIHGFKEMFFLANRICVEHKLKLSFSVNTPDIEEILEIAQKDQSLGEELPCQAIILPPSIESAVYSNQDQRFNDWLLRHHSQGTIICSVCSGAFMLASTGLLRRRMATTHWGLAAQFSHKYPEVITSTEKILINDGDIITAGGLMAWVDLGLELIAQFAGASIMRQLGRLLVVDSGRREQRYYESFAPQFDHGDKDIVKIQHYLQAHFSETVSVAALSTICCLTERTLLRRFVKSTGLKPSQYLQRLRIQKACDLIETTDFSFDVISQKSGYADIGAFRKIFVRIIGLTPGDFKKRITRPATSDKKNQMQKL
ncbi:MAG: helix-turn-helix domain-containing protein, partial [Candidatus Riflebacteria bacterium]|nr:helix-turn-helix domain-containing protein [Candidatus Riflebacteria bacterium]